VLAHGETRGGVVEVGRGVRDVITIGERQTSIGAFGRNAQRTSPLTPAARGTSRAISPSWRGTSCCQPIHATAKP